MGTGVLTTAHELGLRALYNPYWDGGVGFSDRSTPLVRGVAVNARLRREKQSLRSTQGAAPCPQIYVSGSPRRAGYEYNSGVSAAVGLAVSITQVLVLL